MRGVWFVLVVLLAAPVLALQEDFTISPGQLQLNVCACELRELPLLVQNTGSVPSSYQLFKSGSAADWITISDGGFPLESSQSRSVKEFLKIPCGITGTYDAVIAAQSQFGTIRQSSQTFNVQQCADLNVVPLTSYQQQSCPCTPVAFNFQIENNGNAAETYEINVDPAQYVSITETRLMLIPGEKRTITAYVHTPCALFGRKDFLLQVRAVQSGLLGTHPFSLDINACYQYGIGVRDAYDICQNVVNTIPITVTNRAAFQNTYAFSLEGVPWGGVEENWIPLESQQTANTRILLDPRSTAPGIYPITVNAISERGELMQSKPVALNLEACYDVTLIPEMTNPTVIACEDANFAVLVQSAGTKEAMVQFGLTAPAFVRLDRSTATLRTGEALIVNQQMRVPCDAQPFATQLTVAFPQLPELGQQLEAQFSIVPMVDAYALDIAAGNVHMGFAQRDVVITLTNTGIKDATYSIGLVGAEFAALSAQQVHIPAGQSAEVALTLAPAAETAEGEYPLTIAAALVNPYGQVITYERAITVRLREQSTLMRLLPYLLGLLVLMAIAGVLLLKGKAVPGKIVPKFKRKPLIAEPRMAREEKPLIRPLHVPIAARIAERFRRAPTPRHLEVRIPPWLWKLVLLIGILLIAGLGTYFTSPLRLGITPEPERAMPVVRIGDTALTVLPGNIVLIRRPAELPIVLVNAETAETYDITITAPDWVTVQNRVAIPPGQERKLTLTIDPTGQAVGDYPAAFAIVKRGTAAAAAETLTLRVTRVERWQWVVLAIALLLLALAAMLVFLWERIRNLGKWIQVFKRWPKPVPKITAQRIAAAQIIKFRFQRIAPYFIPTIGWLQRMRERMARVSWKRWMVLLIPLAILILLLILGLTTPLFSRTAAVVQEGYESMAARIRAVQPAEINLFAERLPDEIYLDEDGVIIPLRIKNDDPIASYLIAVREDVDWISTDKTVVDIKPKSFGTVNIAVAPTAVVKEGKYKITVGVTLEGGQALFDKGVVLNYQKKLWKKLALWGLLVLLALVLLAMLITVLRRKESERMHRKGAEVKL